MSSREIVKPHIFMGPFHPRGRWLVAGDFPTTGFATKAEAFFVAKMLWRTTERTKYILSFGKQDASSEKEGS